MNNNGNAIILVKSYSCNKNNKEKIKSSYDLGNPSIIYVDLADADDHDNYFIEGFQYVTCENNDETIYLVDKFSPSDMLTTVDNAVDENSVRAVRSVVTSDLGKQGKYASRFEGQVAVSVKEGRLGQGQGRRSLAITKQFLTTSPSDNNENKNKNKDEYALRNLNLEYTPQRVNESVSNRNIFIFRIEWTIKKMSALFSLSLPLFVSLSDY